MNAVTSHRTVRPARSVLPSLPHTLIVSDTFVREFQAAVAHEMREVADSDTLYAVPYDGGLARVARAGQPRVILPADLPDLGRVVCWAGDAIARRQLMLAGVAHHLAPIRHLQDLQMTLLHLGAINYFCAYESEVALATTLLGEAASLLAIAPPDPASPAGEMVVAAAQLRDAALAAQASLRSFGVVEPENRLDAMAAAATLGLHLDGSLDADGPLARLPSSERTRLMESAVGRRLISEAMRELSALPFDAIETGRSFQRPDRDPPAKRSTLLSATDLADESLAARLDDRPTWRVLAAAPPPGDATEQPEIDRYADLAQEVPLAEMPNLPTFAARLEEEFPWLTPAIRRVVADMALHALGPRPRFKMRPLLLVGGPGVGKSRFARRIAELAGVPFRAVNGADGNGATTVSGSGRGWRGGRPCFAIQVIRETSRANPLLLLDEVEKAGTDDRYGTLANFMLSMLEPETSRRFNDPFLLTLADVSAVNWVLTANDVSSLPEALLSRVAIVKVPAPPASAFDGILAGLLDDIAREADLPGRGELPTLGEDITEDLRRRFAAGALSVRQLANATRRILGEVAAARMNLPALSPCAALAAEITAAEGRAGAYDGRPGIGFVSG